MVTFILLMLISLILLVAGIILSYENGPFVYTMFMTTNNCKAPEKPILISHRGKSDTYPGDSYDAVMSIYDQGMGAEFDVQLIASGEIVVFHDEDIVINGYHLNIETTNWDQIKDYQFPYSIEGQNTPYTSRIALYSEIIEGICKKNPYNSFVVDVKFKITPEHAKLLLDVIDNSSCACDENHYFFFELMHIEYIPIFRAEREKHRCKGLVSYWYFIRDDYFKLKTKYEISVGLPDVIDFYYKVVEDAPDILEDYKNAGFCTAVYGHYEDVLNEYDATTYKIIELPYNILWLHDEYVSDKQPFNNLISKFLTGLALVLISVSIIIALLISRFFCRKNKNNFKYQEIEL